MSVLFTDTMTVYNYHKDEQTEKEQWLKSVIHGIQWSHNRAEITTNSDTQKETRAESNMINFDEEIQKFQPSLEVEDAEDAIYNNDVPDITDLISQILSGKNTDK